jgi:hypothetical protein
MSYYLFSLVVPATQSRQLTQWDNLSRQPDRALFTFFQFGSRATATGI